MPRKPQLPPTLHIEGLSTGKGPQGPTHFPDDFSNAMLPMATQPEPKHIPPSAQAFIEAERERAAQSAKTVLRIKHHPDGRLTAHRPEQIEQVPMGWRKIGEWPDGRAILCKIDDPIRRF